MVEISIDPKSDLFDGLIFVGILEAWIDLEEASSEGLTLSTGLELLQLHSRLDQPIGVDQEVWM